MLSSLFFLCCIMQLNAQTVKSDYELLKSSDFEVQNYEKRNVQFNQIKGKSVFVQYNPLTVVANSLLFLYQQVFSVQISASCLYHTSCSEFSKELLKEYGVIKGVPLSADRLTRCNRIAATDIHPLKLDEHSHKVKESTKIYKNKK